MIMLRNFRHVNSLPSRPTRVWRNSTGPPSCCLTANAVQSMSGAASARSNAEPTMSKVRLAQRRASCDRGRSRWSRGSPATGRTRIRSLDTSVMPGARITWTSSASRSQTRLRIALGSS